METHSLDLGPLSEEEQLQIALALSTEDQQATEDARLAARLQAEEAAEGAVAGFAAEAAAGAAAATAAAQAAGMHTAAPPPPAAAAVPPPLQQHVAPPPPGVAPSVVVGGPSGSSLVDSLRVTTADALQRGKKVLGRMKQYFDVQAQQQQQQPHYVTPSGQPVLQHHPQFPHQQPWAPQQQPVQHKPQQQTQQAPPPPPPQQQQRHHLSEDEALALALQQQFDLEEQAERHRQQQQAPVATGPLGAGAAAAVAAATSTARPGASPPQAAAPPRPAQLPASRPPPPAAATPGSDSRRCCAGCGGALFGRFGMAASPYINALGRSWHPGCLVCSHCRQPIGSASGAPFTERGGKLFHIPCFKEEFVPRCAVCGDFIPEQGNRRIVWQEVPFWQQKFCPDKHADVPRCCGCDRLRPDGEAWATLEDGRELCLQCLDTIATDTRDAQPLWLNVLSFFAGLGLELPATPPMMLVDSGALNEAEGRETGGRGRGGGPVFHVRGLCLTEEHVMVRSILRIPGGNPFAVFREAVPVGPTRCHVTAILVLYGLPRLLTGSILAHELMHAFLRMSGCIGERALDAMVEEGLCQLMALIWLEAQQAQGFKDAYEERLAAYLGHTIRSDTSLIYGEGFRMAHEAFQLHGLPAVLASVTQTGRFPPVD